MSLFDTLKGAIGQIAAAEAGPLLGPALATAGLGGLQGLVTQLQSSGLEQHVQSWMSGSSPMPITADDLKAIVSNQQVEQLAQHFGVDPNMVLGLLAQHLPQAVAQANQSGSVQAPG